MSVQTKDSGPNARPKPGEQAAPVVSGKGGGGRLQPTRRVGLTVVGYMLTAVLCGLAVYLWQAPLSSLAIPPMVDESPPSPPSPMRERAKASLDICLRQSKMRNLFEPSIPVPREEGVGQSTAQELASRLQFLGVMDDGGALGALVMIPSRGPGTFHVGDRVAEFVLKDVQPDRLILGLGDDDAILKR